MTETISPAVHPVVPHPGPRRHGHRQGEGGQGPNCCPIPGCCRPGADGRAAGTYRGRPPAVPTLPNPPPSALPDLVPLPAWQIRVSHPRKQAHDYLNFAATVWVGGHGPLDVEGFRSHGSPVMKAYQYFWRNGQVIGRVRAGTMGFDSQAGPQPLALRAVRQVRTAHLGQVGRGAQPQGGVLHRPLGRGGPAASARGLAAFAVGLQGECGSPTALWVAEEMPVGWGDTYIQSIAGQNFDITHVPNGTYYIR